MKTIKAKILVLDFDGLLVDSAPECWLRCIDAAKADISLKNVKFTNANKKTFLRMRHLVGPAHEFYFLIKSLEKNTSDVEVEKKFKKLSKNDNKNALKFKEYFFSSRVFAQNKNMKSWIESNYFFTPALNMAKRFSKSGKLYIATMKDERSVLELLEYHDIFCEKSKVLGKKYGDDKYKHLSHVISDNPLIARDDFLFMDDNIRHIDEIQPLKIRSVLVAWGYGTRLSINQAKEKKIKIMNIEDCSEVVVDE
jgi:phosphoglycolate phosphatase-like HAD superfamily hydrolase